MVKKKKNETEDDGFVERDGENGEQRWEGKRKGDSCFKMNFFWP